MRTREAPQVKKENGVKLGRPRSTLDDVVARIARERTEGKTVAMTAPAFAAVVERVCAVLPRTPVKVGVEAAGHYHRPLLGSAVWPAGWEVKELSPVLSSVGSRAGGESGPMPLIWRRSPNWCWPATGFR
jgi:hypothetical protein